MSAPSNHMMTPRYLFTKLMSVTQGLSGWQLWFGMVALSIAMSELISAAMSWLLLGHVTVDYLITGLVASMLVASVVVAVILYLSDQINTAARRLQIALEGSRISVWEADLRTNEIWIDASWAAFLGVAPAETRVTAADLLKLVHPDDLQDAAAAAVRVREGDVTNYAAEHRVRAANGEWKWILSRGRVIERDAAGWPLRVSGTSTDITERKLAEQRVRKAMEAAESANRSKDEFLATVSHELRTPLHVIIGFTEFAQRTPGLPAEASKYLDRVRNSARILRMHVDELLDISRLDYSKLALAAVPFDLESCVREAIEMHGAKAEAKGLELGLRYANGAPRALVGDAQRLRQVLSNLVDNAIRFTDAGHVLVEVSGDASGPRHAAFLIAVEDTGTGVPEKQRAYIFEKFAQADGSLSRKHTGLGVGLTLSRQIVELMGGRLELEKSSANGSRFAITLTMPLDPRPENKVFGETAP